MPLWRSDGRELLARFRLAEHAAEPAGVLAHGQQWLEIAMLLAGEARLLLLDEPTAGMTVAETARTADLIREIHAATGVAVLLIEHDMSFVERLDCPVVVSDARRRCEGSHQEIQRDPACARPISVRPARVDDPRPGRRLPGQQRGPARALAGHSGGRDRRADGSKRHGQIDLLKAIMGHIPIRAGTIRFRSASSWVAAVRDQQSRIAYVPQGREIFQAFTVEENLILGVLGKRHLATGVPQRLYAWFPIPRSDAGSGRDHVRRRTAAAGDRTRADRLASPLLLDEPSEGIQPSIVQALGTTLGEIAVSERLTILLGRAEPRSGHPHAARLCSSRTGGWSMRPSLRACAPIRRYCSATSRSEGGRGNRCHRRS